MTILQLKYFTTLALLENVSQTAELLNVSQSALSKNILKLEEELGVRLFDRHGRRVSLNAAGEQFLVHANAALEEIGAASTELRSLLSGGRSEICIGMTGIYRPLMECVSAFSELHPEVYFNLKSGIENLAISDINDYDVLVFPDESKYKKLGGYPLYEETLLLAVSRKDPLSERLYITEKALENRKIVFLHTEEGTEFPFHVCNAVLSGFSVGGFVNSLGLHRQMIISGMAVGFVRETDSRLYQDERIKLLPIRSSRFKRNMKICFKREKHLGAMAKEFRDFVTERLQLKT